MKTPLFARLSAILVGAPFVLLWGCIPPPDVPDYDFDPATLEGVVTDDDGYQALSFGGERTRSSATAVHAYGRTVGGRFLKLSDADVERDGSYVITVPAAVENLVLKAIDDDADVVAAVIIERTPAADQRGVANPMTTESSVEAAVFENLHSRGESDEIDSIDLQNRISTPLAVELRDADDGDQEFAAVWEIAVLADAIWSAQQAELHLYTELGVFTTSEELFDIGRSAKARFDARLQDGDNSPESFENYYHELFAAYADELGLTAEAASLAEAAASAAFRGIVTPGFTDNALRSAALGAAAVHEARLLHGGVIDVLNDEGASDNVIESATEAGERLMASVAEANTRSAYEGAFRDFGEQMQGADANMSGSILANYLDIDSEDEDVVTGVVEDVDRLTENLDENLQETARVFIEDDSGRAISLFSWYTVVAAIFDEYYDDVDDAGAPLFDLYDDRGDAATRILALTQAAFRGGF